MFTALGDGADGDGLVFVSYSHVDVAWAQRFRVLLKPLVRRKQLRVWDDTQIRVGDEWHPAIEQAIERSRVALVLVSADFLASDYVMDRELPALLACDVLLAPVLVGDCFWSVVPELAAVQWLHDPGRDGPLGLHAGNPAERDRRIHQACDRLLTVAPEPALAGAAPEPVLPPPPPVSVPAPTRRLPEPIEPPPGHGPRDVPHRTPEPGPVLSGTRTVTDVPAGDVAGALSRVPALPPNYVVRDELDGLVDAVVGTAAGGAVGLTGEPAGLGLHGIGGIGKSVLAAALAADDRIRRRFPDGVYWVTVGERPDVLALQLDLLARLGVGAEVRTRTAAAQALRAALAGRRVLLVVDDVWAVDDAKDFRVTGPQGRLLYTSRDQGVVDAADAVGHRVGVLSPVAARALAGEVLGVSAMTLPSAADRAFAAVGHVPLAVALLAAAVRGRQEWDAEAAGSGSDSWEKIAADLARDADVYGTHPYATTFRALNVAAAALPADLRAALIGLAVFPPDTAIPTAAIARYWAHTRSRTAEETTADLDRLVAAEVLQRGSGDAATVGFHDLAHEYLLLNTDALPALHAQLINAYRALLDEPDQWWTLPLDEPYVWEHLAGHLACAGNRDMLVATVVDPAYQVQRIARDGPHAAEADLAVAARLMTNDLSVAWWRTWLARHAHLLRKRSETEKRPARVATTVLSWLEADPSRPAAIRPTRLTPLLPRPYLAVHSGLQVESSALLRVLTGHTGRVEAVTWSPDGTRLATGGNDGTARIWNPVTGEPLLELIGHTDGVLAVGWSPDGARLATGGIDGIARIWDSASGKPLLQLACHEGGVRAVAWSPDGTRLATAGADDTARIWNPTTGNSLLSTLHPDWVWAVAWSPDGTNLATACDDGTVRIWDPVTGEPLVRLIGHSGRAQALAWRPDGARLATTGTDGTARIWDPVSGGPLVRAPHPDWVCAVAWSPDGTRLVTASNDGTARIWDSITGKFLLPLAGHPDGARAVAWSPDGTRVATTGNEGTARIWDPAVGTETPADGGSVVTAVAWSLDGTRLATGGTDVAVRIFDRTRTTTLSGGVSTVLSIAWSVDGTYLATAEAGTVVRLWSTKTLCAIDMLTSHTDWVRAASWSPDGKLLATAGDDTTVRLWQIDASGSLSHLVKPTVTTLDGHTDWIYDVTWSPDGARLATASRDRSVRLWEPRTGTITATLMGHTGPVRAVTWSPDGTRLASTGDDRTLRLWAPLSQPVAIVETGHRDAVHSVAWSPDGRYLATADHTGLVIVWDGQLCELTSLQLKPSQCLAWSAPLIAVGQPGRPAILELRDPVDVLDLS